MKIVVWLTEGTWEACIDAVRDQPATSIELLHVIDSESLDALAGARASLLGRGFVADTGPLADNLKAAQQVSSAPHRPVSAGRQADRHDGADQNERSSLLVQAPAC